MALVPLPFITHTDRTPPLDNVPSIHLAACLCPHNHVFGALADACCFPHVCSNIDRDRFLPIRRVPLLFLLAHHGRPTLSLATASHERVANEHELACLTSAQRFSHACPGLFSRSALYPASTLHHRLGACTNTVFNSNLSPTRARHDAGLCELPRVPGCPQVFCSIHHCTFGVYARALLIFPWNRPCTRPNWYVMLPNYPAQPLLDDDEPLAPDCCPSIHQPTWGVPVKSVVTLTSK